MNFDVLEKIQMEYLEFLKTQKKLIKFKNSQLIIPECFLIK